jgi:hypothetical protein
MRIISWLSLLLAVPLAAQTINPNQIRPSANNGDVLTTTAGQTVWGSAGAQKWAVVAWNGLQTINYQTFAPVIVSAPTAGVVPAGCTGSGSDTTPSSYNGGAVTYPLATGTVTLGVWDLNTTTQLCTITTSASDHVGVPSGPGGTISAGDTIVVTGNATPDATYQYFGVSLAVNVGDRHSRACAAVDHGRLPLLRR